MATTENGIFVPNITFPFPKEMTVIKIGICLGVCEISWDSEVRLAPEFCLSLLMVLVLEVQQEVVVFPLSLHR